MICVNFKRLMNKDYYLNFFNDKITISKLFFIVTWIVKNVIVEIELRYKKLKKL